MPTVQNTYNTEVINEDLLQVITNLSPTETQLFTGLKRGKKATNTYHEYPVDSYAAVTGTSTDKKAVEGADWGDDDVTTPTREGNYTQIIKQTYKVTGTAQAVDTAGMTSPKAYQQAKALVNWKHKGEWSILHGVKAAGDASTAREMGGLFDLTTTNAVAETGTLTETRLGDYIQLGWENSSAKITEIYGGAYVKRTISGFTSGLSKNIDASDKRLVNAVDWYETDFGLAKVFLHRYIDSVVSSVGTHNLLLVAPETLFYSGLREPVNKDVPALGDYEKGVIVGEFTIEDRYEAANVAVKGIEESEVVS